MSLGPVLGPQPWFLLGGVGLTCLTLQGPREVMWAQHWALSLALGRGEAGSWEEPLGRVGREGLSSRTSGPTWARRGGSSFYPTFPGPLHPAVHTGLAFSAQTHPGCPSLSWGPGGVGQWAGVWKATRFPPSFWFQDTPSQSQRRSGEGRGWPEAPGMG